MNDNEFHTDFLPLTIDQGNLRSLSPHHTLEINKIHNSSAGWREQPNECATIQQNR